MEPIFRKNYTVGDHEVDRFGRLKNSMILFYTQDVAGQHCIELGADYDAMAAKGLFWAVIRHRAQIDRLPLRGETITVETWPMPTTRVAYPRATVACDAQGRELFRIISLWVIMDIHSRTMILPGRSGVEILGTTRGGELATPGSLAPKVLEHSQQRTVRFSDLDRNGHMNNCRYLQWLADLLPSAWHREHEVAEFTVCYLSETLEGEQLQLQWQRDADGVFRTEVTRQDGASSTGHSRVFAAQILYK